jgi:hypothetical protein
MTSKGIDSSIISPWLFAICFCRTLVMFPYCRQLITVEYVDILDGSSDLVQVWYWFRQYSIAYLNDVIVFRMWSAICQTKEIQWCMCSFGVWIKFEMRSVVISIVYACCKAFLTNSKRLAMKFMDNIIVDIILLNWNHWFQSMSKQTTNYENFKNQFYWFNTS